MQSQAPEPRHRGRQRGWGGQWGAREAELGPFLHEGAGAEKRRRLLLWRPRAGAG